MRCTVKYNAVIHSRTKYRVILRGLPNPVELFSTTSKGKLVKRVALLGLEQNTHLFVQIWRGDKYTVQSFKSWRLYNDGD